MLIKNSIKIYDCYKYKEPKLNVTFDRQSYTNEYYSLHKQQYLNYNKLHKERLKKLKAIWFQKNKERLRIKWGYKTRYKTKNKSISIYPPTTYEVKKCLINFD